MILILTERYNDGSSFMTSARPGLSSIRKRLLLHPFVPPRFLANAHLQALAFLVTPYFQTSLPKVVKKQLRGADNNMLEASCWFQDNKDDKQTIIIVNGFEGYRESGDSYFGTAMVHKAFAHGYNAILLRQRGEGPTVHLTKSIGDFYVEDLPLVLQEIAGWNKNSMYIVGHSLGGWAAALAIGKLRHTVPATVAGLVISASPTNTKETWTHIEKNLLYNWFLLRTYKHLIHRRAKVDPPGTWDLEALSRIKTKREFFETYMHAFGFPKKFATLEEYFSKTDTIPYLKNIHIPTLTINALDDPVVPAEPFMTPEVQNNPNIITLLPQYGSHGCFIAAKKYESDLDRHWAQNRALEFIHLLAESNPS